MFPKISSVSGILLASISCENSQEEGEDESNGCMGEPVNERESLDVKLFRADSEARKLGISATRNFILSGSGRRIGAVKGRLLR